MRGVNRKILLGLIGTAVIAAVGILVAKHKFKHAE